MEPSALDLKSEGNAKFQAKEFQAAVDAYSRSLDLDPSQHLCYSNRSAAYLKLASGQEAAGNLKEQALADAQKCVELMPSWAKGYNRVATALIELKRWDEALAICRQGVAACEDAKDKESIEKTAAEVPKWRFCGDLRGTWHGTVNEVLGGYEQEMEFLDNERVRVEVLGRSIVGSYWVNVEEEPTHLSIQVPAVDMPPGMPPPPPVPYIARIDEVGLHLCCPYLQMVRPTDFTGPGYVLMKKGGLAKPDASEVSNLSHEQKLRRCAQELVKALPERKIEDPNQGDSEAVAGEKLMAQVRFESSMYNVKQQFGEDTMRVVLDAAKGTAPKELADTKELEQLIEKLRQCGLLEDGDAPSGGGPEVLSGPATQAPPAKEAGRAAGSAAPSPKAEASTAGPGAPSGEAEDDGCSPALVVGSLVAVASVLAGVAFTLSRKHRS